MRFLLLFASTQGQTARIMAHVADRLRLRGHDVTLLQAQELATKKPAETGPAETGLEGFDAVILAGSVHAGRYQTELLQAAHGLVHGAAPGLNALPGLFLSVSLTAAGDDPAEHAELDRLAQGFLSDTGWKGARIAQVAGALRFSAYGFFEYWAMRWIARQRGRPVTGKEDIELTDWQALDATLEGFLAAVELRSKPRPRPPG